MFLIHLIDKLNQLYLLYQNKLMLLDKYTNKLINCLIQYSFSYRLVFDSLTGSQSQTRKTIIIL